MSTVTLPLREQNQFKLIIKNYETKQYKKALNIAEGILKNFPQHAETLAMKGLTLKAMNKSDEGYKCVKDALLLSRMNSHVCWHVYGLMYKSDRNYVMAAKSYLNALRIDPDNQQILKDLAILQVHIRDLNGFLNTRNKLLELKPANKHNWIAYSVAHCLVKNYEYAINVIDAYLSTVDEKSLVLKQEDKVELNEIILYKAMLIKESGQFERLNKFLEESKSKILDKVAFLEYKAIALSNLGKNEETASTYHQLLKLNPDNLDYLDGYLKHKGFSRDGKDLNEEQIKDLLALYDKLASQFPHSLNVKRFALDVAKGDEFRTRLEKFVKPYLQQTIPSLFNALKDLYIDKEKVDIIEKVFLGYVESLQKLETLSPPDGKKEPPGTLLWVYQYLAYHYDARGMTKEALEYIDKAIKHTPTVLELYMAKGFIYSHAGNPAKAAEMFDQARRMDLADRYLNTIASKFLIRANKIEEAEKTIILFSRDQADGAENNLYDMQCMWWENECGDAHFRRKEYGRALKNYYATDKHFQDIYDDQYEFHAYCLRKMTLRAYIEALHFEDNLFSHKYFYRAACGIVRTYLQIHDHPEEVKPIEPPSSKKTKKKKEKDDDPYGNKLQSVPDPLEKATKHLKMLLKYSRTKLQPHLFAVDVYLKKMLRAIKQALKIEPSHPKVHQAIIRLFRHVELEEKLDDIAKQVLTNERKAILGEKTLEEYNAEYLKANQNSLASIVASAEMMMLLDEKKQKEAVELITKSQAQGELKDYIEAYESLKSVLKDENAASAFKKQIQEKFPFADLNE